MSKEIEDRQWYQGKSKILFEYTDKSRDAEAAIAARGFSSAPGFAQEMNIKFERDVKLQLSEINAKIVEAAIEREKQNAKYYYDRTKVDYKNAWEIDKENLLSEMQFYITELKRLQVIDEETLDREALEIEAQRTYILQQETDIKLQLELLEQDKLRIRGSTIPYEKQLSDEQVRTLRKKLDLIPILNSLVIAEEEVLNRISSELIPAQLDYYEELEAYIAKILTVLPFKEDIAGQEYSNALKDIQIAEKEIVVADKQEDVVNKQLESVDKELANAEKEQELILSKDELYTERENSLNKEKEVSEKERDLTDYEIDNAETEKDNASKRIGNAEKQQEVSALDKVLSQEQRSTAEKDEDLAEKQSDYLDLYRIRLSDILQTARIRRDMAHGDRDLLENQYSYLELRILIQEARNALKELANDDRLTTLEHDIDLSYYRSNTQLNASLAHSLMISGNENSSGLAVNEDSGGTFSVRESNMLQHDLDQKDDRQSKRLDMREEMLEYREDKIVQDFDLRLRQTYAGTFSGEYISVDASGNETSKTATEHWTALGTEAAPGAINDAAEEVAGEIAAHGRVISKLVHVLGSE